MKNIITYSKANIDWTLIVLYFILVFIGFFNLYSSDFQVAGHNDFMDTAYGKQFVWIIVALVLAFIIMFIETVAFPMTSYIIYLFVVFLLFLVFVLGKTVNDSKSWLIIAGIDLQPSELAKFASSLAVARFLSQNPIDFNKLKFGKIAILFLIILLPLGFIFLQPDFGTALSFVAFTLVFYREGMSGMVIFYMALMALVFVFALKLNQVLFILLMLIAGLIFLVHMLKNKKFYRNILIIGVISFSAIYFLEVLLKLGISWYQIILLTSIIISIYSLILFTLRKETKAFIVILFMFSGIMTQFSSDLLVHKVLKQHHRDRIEVLFDEHVDPQGIGYNLRQSKIAIASGGFFGKGYLKGTQTKLNFVPAHNTDFIFCTVAEEWGLLGTFILLGLYAFLLIRILNKAEQQVSSFSRIYGYSVASFIFIHIVVNIAMAIGLFPVVGIPLPFFSYGGSSMLSFTIMLFIFIKLDSERNLNL